MVIMTKPESDNGAGSTAARNGALLTVKQLKKYFPIRKGILSRVVGNLKAVDGVDLTL